MTGLRPLLALALCLSALMTLVPLTSSSGPPVALPILTLGLEQRLGDFVPGRVLVRLRGAADDALADQIARSHGHRLLSRVRPLNWYQFQVPEGREGEAIASLRRQPEVAWAQLEGLSQAMLVPNDTFYPNLQWNLRRIGMEAAWDITRGASGTIVAVLDTGVDLKHPELADNLVPGYDFVNDDPLPEDDSSHGTHTAGIIAARGNNAQGIAGIAWETKIMPVKVLDARGVGPESALIKGLIYAADQGARIINLSSGTTRGSPAMAEAVAYANQKGALIISAAGNSGDRENPVIYPAGYPGVIAVGATDRSDAVAPFSQRQPYITVVAPGVDIPSAAWEQAGFGRYAMATGTSAAAPHVAGLAALLWSIDPSLTSEQVVQLITAHAHDLGPPGRDNAYGHGLISASRTLEAMRPRPRATATPVATPAVRETPGPLPTLAPLPTPVPLPRAPSDWYFAEGSTRPPFDTWLHILNPNNTPTEARITYRLADGGAREQRVTVPPSVRTSIRVNDVLPGAEFSIHVHAEATVFVERAVFFGHDGHVTSGVSLPSTTWYLADGSSKPPFDTWVLLQNPNPRPATARVTFVSDDGSRRHHLQFLPPESRRSIYANLLLQAEGFSTTVVADAPIVVERAMYFDSAQGGHGAGAVTSPAKTWYLAEGSTRPGFETWLVFYNPGELPAQVQVRYPREQGDPAQSSHTVPAGRRARVALDRVLPNSSFGAVVESSTPIVVERVMFFGGAKRGGHSSPGVLAPSLEWHLAEGSTSPPFNEFVAVLNPNRSSADLEVTLLPADGAPAQTFLFPMGPESRLTLDLNRLAPNMHLSTRVRSSKPVVVERSMYFANGSGGTNAAGVPR